MSGKSRLPQCALVRNDLKCCLEQETTWSVNPFKQGLAGGTNNHHCAQSNTAKDDFAKHYVNNDNSPEVRLGLKVNSIAKVMGITGDDAPTKLYNPGAIMGVWAAMARARGVPHSYTFLSIVRERAWSSAVWYTSI